MIGITIQLEIQTNILKTYGNLFLDPEGASKIEITLCANGGITEVYADSGCYSSESNPRACY